MPTLRKLVETVPVCPFCRTSVEQNSIWCKCGANLSRFPSIPDSASGVREWLARHVPDVLQAPDGGGASLIAQAQKRVIDNQDAKISKATKRKAEEIKVRQLISEFLADCTQAGLDPVIDIGQLRRERWRQWKRVPAEYQQKTHPPLKNFKLSPGYVFEVRVSKFKEELCVGVDGTLYKHHLNAPDPYPLSELMNSATAEKVAEALITSMVKMLQSKQHPQPHSASAEQEPEVFEPQRPAAKTAGADRGPVTGVTSKSAD